MVNCTEVIVGEWPAQNSQAVPEFRCGFHALDVRSGPLGGGTEVVVTFTELALPKHAPGQALLECVFGEKPMPLLAPPSNPHDYSCKSPGRDAPGNTTFHVRRKGGGAERCPGPDLQWHHYTMPEVAGVACASENCFNSMCISGRSCSIDVKLRKRMPLICENPQVRCGNEAVEAKPKDELTLRAWCPPNPRRRFPANFRLVQQRQGLGREDQQSRGS